ncbi:hypothetical protein PsAD2_02589 [Pseudovibrio axinellae]|uniref:Uncharacterized protein n=1 Tax=Pseudovibrio axinellae TaxID=989403 RepID=A0A165Y986_9HYPH|nr:hypothetical protein [Pseudovibrio axinellae]KZL18582.1 hypothetical protein PsAD2_02589 [Pseudovibrio axinellae]SER95261.1 hypothetical protein SAMN05421798_1802 [Pseudovibrio axinellae]
MRIKEAGRAVDVEVYGIYWAEYQGKLQRMHFVVPYEGYEGFVAVPEVECVVTQPQLNSNFQVIKNSEGQDLILHEALIEGDLLDELIEHEPRAMQTFKKRLTKKE